MREAFALQKLLTFFQEKYWHISDINVWNFNEMLTDDVVSFDQPSLDVSTLFSGFSPGYTNAGKSTIWWNLLPPNS